MSTTGRPARRASPPPAPRATRPPAARSGPAALWPRSGSRGSGPRAARRPRGRWRSETWRRALRRQLRQAEAVVEDAGVDLGRRRRRRRAQRRVDRDLPRLARGDRRAASAPARSATVPSRSSASSSRVAPLAQLRGKGERVEVDRRALRRRGLALGGRQQDQHRGRSLPIRRVSSSVSRAATAEPPGLTSASAASTSLMLAVVSWPGSRRAPTTAPTSGDHGGDGHRVAERVDELLRRGGLEAGADRAPGRSRR